MKQKITRKFLLLIISFFLYGLTTISSNAFAFCSGGFNDPNYESCVQQEEANDTQKKMLELQREQMEQEHQDNMMRDAEESLGHRRWE